MRSGTRVSVVVPLYNKERHVGEAIRSVLSQSISELELIVVDDGSTDGGPEIVRRERDPRVRLIGQPRRGVSAARNHGVASAAADLVAFLDADDVWDSDLLETLLRLRATFPDCEVFATNYRYLLPSGDSRPTALRGLPGDEWEGVLLDYFGVAADSDPPLWTSAIGATKRAIQSVGGFPTTLTASEDLVTWARLAARYAIAYSAAPRATYRLGQPFYGLVRDPDLDSEAGVLLETLFREVDPRRGASLARYLSSWHRNRASRYLQLGRPTEAKEEVSRMRRFQAPDLRYLVYSLVSALPPFPAAQLAKGFTVVNRLRRLHKRRRPGHEATNPDRRIRR